MIDLLKIVIFIGIVSSIFWISNPIALAIVALTVILVMLVLKSNITFLLKVVIRLSPLLLITLLFNWWLADFKEAIFVLSRLIICFGITFVFSKICTPMQIANGMEKLFQPLKLFKVDTKYISLMISIAICMIPIFIKEISTTMKAIEAKGQKASIKNIKIFSRPLLISLMKKTNEMEKSLISKAYK